MFEFHGSVCSVLIVCRPILKLYIYFVVQNLGRQYLFFHSNTGYQLFKCQIFLILGFLYVSRVSCVQLLGLAEIRLAANFSFKGAREWSLKSENMRNSCNLCQIYGFGGDMAK